MQISTTNLAAHVTEHSTENTKPTIATLGPLQNQSSFVEQENSSTQGLQEFSTHNEQHTPKKSDS